MRLDFLVTRETSPKGAQLVHTLYRAARRNHDCVLSGALTNRRDAALVVYGAGGPDRAPIIEAHRARGGRLLLWDAGYWHRRLSLQQRPYRVSLDAFHPQAWVMKGLPPDPGRFANARLPLDTIGNSNGPILLVASGPKSDAIGAKGWTISAGASIRHAFPGRRLVYRPKPGRPNEPGVSFDAVSTGPIEEALKGVALVVCRHSNVAVDACRLGVPVVCEDGAAAAIYPQLLSQAEKQPNAATRQAFLERLAWWQWSMDDITRGHFWPWAQGVLGAAA